MNKFTFLFTELKKSNWSMSDDCHTVLFDSIIGLYF